jgi:hypothetical protein
MRGFCTVKYLGEKFEDIWIVEFVFHEVSKRRVVKRHNIEWEWGILQSENAMV